MPEVRSDVESEVRRVHRWKWLARGCFMALGAVLAAVALEIFLVPNNIIDGGITGIAIILSHFTHMRLGLFLFALNLPFLLVGYQQIGRTFAVSTFFSITVLSFTASLLVPVPGLTDDPLLAAVFGGIILGAGVGLIIRAGGSSDGTEVIAILVNRSSPWSIGQIVMFINVFILGSAGFVFGWNQAMYSLIAYFIAFKTIDIVTTGFEETKSIWVISDRYQEIAEAMLHRLGRGVTLLHGEGAFTGDNKKVLFTVITRLEEAKLKSLVEDIDPDAFLAIAPIAEVRGGRFKKRNIH
ncbi:membrane protein [Alicyclobacillus cellulosilyticus]|uniref:Membrane protein n=1 Tax=Alicyclobacillus cellulosilyticus TaxID=1003997 RepID=A0A917K4T8_9BACL|nr:YitT family protein [Alicyclobacillus cellulosilyticus]GGI99017.1 membrane protein [Alicyclobacillus cellulosilyticus]